jgi:hypothetical protein
VTEAAPPLREPPPRLRALCLALPDVVERQSHGEPGWFVRGRLFLTLADHHHDDRVAFWAAAPDGAQEAHVGAAPDRYFRPPYYGHRGWIGMYLDVPVDWDEAAARVREAHAVVANRR